MSKTVSQPLHTSQPPNRLCEPYATIVDRVNERDRDFLAKHPNARGYVRPYVPGEIPPDVFSEAGVVPGQDCWVLVHNIAPGVRCREPIGELAGPRPLPSRISVILPDGTIFERVPVYAGDPS